MFPFIIASRLALHSSSQSFSVFFELCPLVSSGAEMAEGGTPVVLGLGDSATALN
jgi:hypothetical protein